MRPGTGLAACHHGEILQGVFLDERGRPCRGLVTLPMARPLTRATFTPLPGTPAHRVLVPGRGRAKAARAAALAVAECARLSGTRACGGLLHLSTGVPVGLGLGSSTSDVLAAIRAVSACFRTELPPGAIARLAVSAERAADPTMFGDRPVLFAQRRGLVLEELGAALPPMAVVGCLTGGGRAVSTLSVTGRTHREDDVDAYERLRDLLRRAIAAGDAAEVGRVAAESARRNQRLLPKAELGALEGVARACGAVGLQVAHSGNVAGLLFDAGQQALRERLDECRARLRGHGLTAVRTFRTPPENEGERPWTTTYPKRSADRT
ncbi:uncharacterized protein involved in propanediol utilization [Spinactinospora alkalitolerans]|uniref:Uncharacterized protein involved in propanediol utilization n=1 Tax=Spinactinospora alkalitolerans TaxID=687207 RepID=A0A852TRS5_9ACTN|nr:GHMP kinase [Spinactinospora alkalitolerans]NYE47096.1 uncharacterized protein involved in propanediol utilization [Spinactinospora alkalitolerans]